MRAKYLKQSVVRSAIASSIRRAGCEVEVRLADLSPADVRYLRSVSRHVVTSRTGTYFSGESWEVYIRASDTQDITW